MQRFVLFLSLAALAVAPACSGSSNDPAPAAGPKEYNVEYRLTSPTATSLDYIDYANETGGRTTISQIPTPVPATFRFKRTMKLGDAVGFLGSISGGTPSTEVRGIILLDGREMKNEVGRGERATVNIVHFLQ